MGTTVNGGSWRLELVDGWREQRDNAEYVLSPPDGGPVLTISSPRLDHALSETDLQYLNREHVADGHAPERVTLGDFTGLAFRYVEDDIYWRHWDVVRGNLCLSISYDCALSERGKHDDAIDRMLASLRVNEGAI